jgi:hypothetical protein
VQGRGNVFEGTLGGKGEQGEGDVEGRRKMEEAKRLLEADMRRMEGGRDWGEAVRVKREEGRV